MGFLSYLINGISLGSVYALIALGYTMVDGIAKMLNFAHGDVIMIGSYVVFSVVSVMGMPPAVGILVAIVACIVLGITIERIAYKPLRGASPLAVNFWCKCKVIYFCSADSSIEFGRRTVSDYWRGDCDNYCLYCHCDCIKLLCKVYKSRTCYVGRI